jgi:hypothetical protein
LRNGKPHWGWYPATALVPPVGIVVGIIAAAKDRVGPALALWATAALAAMAWATIVATLAVASMSNDISSEVTSFKPSYMNREEECVWTDYRNPPPAYCHEWDGDHWAGPIEEAR